MISRCLQTARSHRSHAEARTLALESLAAIEGVDPMSSNGLLPGTFSGTLSAENDYAEMARRPLEAEQCALVVVDMQEKLLPPIFNKETLVKNSQLLIRLAKILAIPVM